MTAQERTQQILDHIDTMHEGIDRIDTLLTELSIITSAPNYTPPRTPEFLTSCYRLARALESLEKAKNKLPTEMVT